MGSTVARLCWLGDDSSVAVLERIDTGCTNPFKMPGQEQSDIDMTVCVGRPIMDQVLCHCDVSIIGRQGHADHGIVQVRSEEVAL